MSVLLLALGDYALTLLRIFYGAVFFVHGWPKIKDLKQNAKNFEGMGFRPGSFWGTLAALLEFFGGIALVAGFYTQLVALALALEMIVAMFWKIKQGQKFAFGYEFDMALVVIGLVLAASGGGLYALDNFLFILLPY